MVDVMSRDEQSATSSSAEAGLECGGAGHREPRDLSVLRPDMPPWHRAVAGASPPPPPIGICSGDGILSFALTSTSPGVHVKRTFRRADGSKLLCSTVFLDERSFAEWLDADDMRFSYALLFQQLRSSFRRLNEAGGRHEGR
jgi:hypothetical protein